MKTTGGLADYCLGCRTRSLSLLVCCVRACMRVRIYTIRASVAVAATWQLSAGSNVNGLIDNGAKRTAEMFGASPRAKELR